VFEAVYAKRITHLSVEALLTEYRARKFKFGTALEGPINQYRRAGREDEAIKLALVEPHVRAAQKFFHEAYAFGAV